MSKDELPLDYWTNLVFNLDSTKTDCLFDKLSPEDRMKPMGISCPCKRCSPFSLNTI